MQLIAPLLTGIAAAANGTAELHRRGATGTRVTWYSDFEATAGSNSSGDDLSLDQYGAYGAVYVDELTNVVVKNSSGETVATFVAGVEADSVEIRSPSLEGTDYTTGGTAANKPTTVGNAFDLWKTLNGALFGKVLSGGSSVSIQSALGPLAGLVYNVKDPTYGAEGDGVEDDRAAIQGAIDAANAAGGGIVFFPYGTYRVTAALDVKAGVMLVGIGYGGTVLTVDHASNNLLEIAAQTVAHLVTGMTLQAAQANSGKMIEFQGAQASTVISELYIGNSNCDGTVLVDDNDASAQHVHIKHCSFNVTAETQDAVNADNHTSGRWELASCEFTTPATYNPTNALIYGNILDMHQCELDLSSSTSGTFSCFKASSTTVLSSIVDCVFVAGGGATITGMELGTYGSSSNFLESSNYCPDYTDTDFTLYSYTVTAAHTTGKIALGTRALRSYRVETDGSVTLPADQYGVLYVEKTGTAVASYTMNDAPVGSTVDLVIINQGGGTTGAQLVDIRGATSHTIQNAHHSCYRATWFTDGASYYHWAGSGISEDAA